MDGGQLRQFHMPRFAMAVAVIALFAAVWVPTAGASSPSQDQYGSALPGVGGGNGSGSPSTSSTPSGTAESTIPVAPSSSSSSTGSEATGSDATGSGGSAGGSSNGGSNGGSSHQGDQGSANPGNSLSSPTSAQQTGHPVPQIAADSAGDGWVPWFIGGMLALAAAGGVLVYRNRRRAAQS